MIQGITLAIGKESSGDDFVVDLVALPHLFISFSHGYQLHHAFRLLMQQVDAIDADIRFAMSLGSKLAQQAGVMALQQKMLYRFTHQAYNDLPSIGAFIRELKNEMKKRKPAGSNGTYFSKLPLMVIFIDDLSEIFKAANKRTAIDLLEMLIDANRYKMHFIIGSPGIYRGLLEEVIRTSSSLQKRAVDILSTAKISQVLGAELVINPDGLLFFREKGQSIHKRFYPAASV